MSRSDAFLGWKIKIGYEPMAMKSDYCLQI
jgi:hypothetical protein